MPHGWKNKALLVNLNDVGPEALCRAEDVLDHAVCTVGQPMPPGTQVRNQDSDGVAGGPSYNNWRGHNQGWTNPPYYNKAVLKIATFKNSGEWTSNDCGSVGAPGSGSVAMCAGWAMNANDGCRTMP